MLCARGTPSILYMCPVYSIVNLMSAVAGIAHSVFFPQLLPLAATSVRVIQA